MSDVKNEVNKQTDSLAPIQDKDRIMGWGSYLMLWLGGCISIGTLTMGSAQLDKGLNLMQVFLAVLIGSTILVIGICANDRFSYKSGAPYAVQLKSAYGTKGNIVPVMIRGLPAIVWYGFQTWLGGSAINQISIAIFGYDNVVLPTVPGGPDYIISKGLPRNQMGGEHRRRGNRQRHALYVICMRDPVLGRDW